jgi:hypothetical protein
MVLCKTATAVVLLNEVCYDPPGADAGREFVELINIGPATVDLAGYRLEFGNGAVGPQWSGRWTGQPGDRIEPGGLFLIVDLGWTGPPADAEVRLALQNGPDALRLVRADGSVDLVGWGHLDWPDMYEGRPHPGAPNRSLARRPDGHDTDDNAADFVAADMTPGARNWETFAASLLDLAWEPPSLLVPGAPLTARLRLRNTGIAPIVAAEAELSVGRATATIDLDPLPPDEETDVTATVVPAVQGRLPASLLLRAAATGDTCRLVLGHVQVGPAAVRLTEVMAAPLASGEWCEIVNADSVPRNLAELALRDEDGAWRQLPEWTLAPGDCQLIAQDAVGLAAWLDELRAVGGVLACDPLPPLPLAGWPILNNSAPAGRDFADRLYLGDLDGTVLDHVTIGLGSGRAPRGQSLERGPDLSWRPSTATVGATPGCLPDLAPAVPPGGFLLQPNPYAASEGDGVLRIHLTVPEGAGGWTLRLYDLWGRLVRDLGGDDLGPGQRSVAWDVRDESGRGLAPGGYVAVLHWRYAGGSAATAARRLLVIREARH